MKKDKEDTPSFYQQLTPLASGSITTLTVQGSVVPRILNDYFIRYKNEKHKYQLGRFYYGKLINQEKEIIDEIILSIREENFIELHAHGGKTSAKLIINFLETLTCKNNTTPLQEGNYYLQALNEIQTLREYHFLVEQTKLYQKMLNVTDNYTNKEIVQILEKMICSFELEEKNRAKKNVCLCGVPNAGKSSLLNAILGKNRSLVSSIERTTRDTVTEKIQIHGHYLYFSDTAGLHQPDNYLDEQSVEQAYLHIQQADYLLWIQDESKPFSAIEQNLIASIKIKTPNTPFALCLTKTDLQTNETSFNNKDFHKVFRTSAKQNSGIKEMLEEVISTLFPNKNNSQGLSAISKQMVMDIQEKLIFIQQKVDLKIEDSTILKDILLNFINHIPLLKLHENTR